jgi:hypothetical protein
LKETSDTSCSILIIFKISDHFSCIMCIFISPKSVFYAGFKTQKYMID